jgi:hypothetical protein
MEILQASVSGQISEESLLITDYRPLIPEFGSISSSRCQTARGARPCNREDAIASAREFKFLNERDLASAARLRRGFGGHLCGLKSGPPTEAASAAKVGGARRDRTDDLLLAKQALSQLSYGPDRYQWSVIRKPRAQRAI